MTGDDYLYLAHPRESRFEIREWELDFENRSGINLLNPFFEIDKEDKEIDIHEENPFNAYAILNDSTVEEEIDHIKNEKAKGVVVIIDGALSYGTIQEMIYSKLHNKPVFSLITNGQEENPWLKFHSTKIFTNRNELENFLEKIKDNGFYLDEGIMDEETSEVQELIDKIKNLGLFHASLDKSFNYQTLQSLVYAHFFKKKIYLLVTNGHKNHPWLQYHTTKIFTEKDIFEKEVADANKTENGETTDGGEKSFETKFSGVKDNFSSGATRDNHEGKGRYDLITPIGLKRLAQVYERGAVNHGDRNWEKGIPLARLLESATRHTYQYLEGMRDEDHLGQAAWNLFAAMHVEEMVKRGLLPKELDNLPNFVDKENKEENNSE